MTKKETLEFERLKRLLASERLRADTVWNSYRYALYELVDVKMKLEQIEKVLKNEE